MPPLAHRRQRVVEAHGDVADEEAADVRHFQAAGNAAHQAVGFQVGGLDTRIQAVSNSGCRVARRSRFKAAPLGWRTPDSQLMAVGLETFNSAATTA